MPFFHIVILDKNEYQITKIKNKFVIKNKRKCTTFLVNIPVKLISKTESKVKNEFNIKNIIFIIIFNAFFILLFYFLIFIIQPIWSICFNQIATIFIWIIFPLASSIFISFFIICTIFSAFYFGHTFYIDIFK